MMRRAPRAQGDDRKAMAHLNNQPARPLPLEPLGKARPDPRGPHAADAPRIADPFPATPGAPRPDHAPGFVPAPVPTPGGSPAPRKDAGLGRTLYLALEFLTLFGAGPALWYAGVVRPHLFVVLIGFGLATLLLLRRDRAFERAQFLNLEGVRKGIGPVLARFVLLGVLLTGTVCLFAPDQLFILVRKQPGLWLAIMILYPLFSVYPQEIIYRTFLFHRYRDLFPGKLMMIAASAAAFGFAHVILRNELAVLLTIIGGVLFAHTYQRSRSTLLAVIEHALYGNLLFTIGLGASFYLGAVR
jgi:membrane protease YdiL (CAAX protease family)